MLSRKYPMSKPIEYRIEDREDFYKMVYNQNYSSIFMIEFHGLEPKFLYDSYLSASKALDSENVTENNGRIFRADRVRIVLTNIDMQIVDKCYSYDSITIYKFYYFYNNYLPSPIIESVIELYEKKTILKNVKGKEVEYLVSKGMLNSIYGMCVTAIVRDNILYGDTWGKEKADIPKLLEAYNKSKKRFLYYPWGVFITAYARQNLWDGIFNIGSDYIYSDTDSIKFTNLEAHQDYINDYNKRVTQDIKMMCNALHFDFNRTRPKTIKGKMKPIGVWDYEGKYEKFKTLGAKRYIYLQDGKLHTTIAGLSKAQGRDYIASKKNPFRFFNNNMSIPADKTGKNSHTYIDDEKEGYIKDYTGKKEYIKALSGIHLEEAPFNLSFSDRFLNFLEHFFKGELLVNGF